jgi:hypothetical protein
MKHFGRTVSKVAVNLRYCLNIYLDERKARGGEKMNQTRDLPNQKQEHLLAATVCYVNCN